MTREELHKAAEDFYMCFPLSENGPMEGDLVIPESDVWKLMTGFHIHQTKKMLEGIIKKARIHQMIPDHTEYGNGYVDGASALTGQIIELLKQLEE